MKISAFLITFLNWISCAVFFTAAFAVIGSEHVPAWQVFVGTSALTLPAFITLWIALPLIRRLLPSFGLRLLVFVALIALICLPYAMLITEVRLLGGWSRGNGILPAFGLLAGCNLGSFLLLYNWLYTYLSKLPHAVIINFPKTIKQTEMYNNTTEQPSNRLLFKGLITAGLILLLLIPTIFVANLVDERQERFKEVAKDVSSKWASEQTLSGPFISIPYTTRTVEGKNLITTKTNVIVLPDNLQVKSTLQKEERPRSIYKVLLYKSSNNFTGAFKQETSPELLAENLDYANAKICFALTDFKGIEEETEIIVNGNKIRFMPGLPQNQIGDNGLSAPFPLTAEGLQNGFDFSMDIKLKGSESLKYLPLAGSSKFSMASPWPNPSFDGNVLPGVREVKDSGFNAEWVFNRANLPFTTMTEQQNLNPKSLAFGVTLVQPADNYAKTSRSVKYSILFIGLTFALFFIIEIMQKNPFHPMQYLLVGLALVIFYTLLLSIGEYLQFDLAYIISAVATILLISTYAKAHFRSLKTGLLFFGLLSVLYSFIFVLIRLEDTALLVGSIGLFVILALVMFASRKIQWYGPKPVQTADESGYLTT